MKKTIRAVVSDIDGVMTDGSLYYCETGVEPTKVFHVHDGMGVKLLQKAGIEVIILSGGSSKPLELRLKTLGITRSYCGIEEKLPVLKKILNELKINPEEVAYIGDDVNDIEAIEFINAHKGLTFCPKNANFKVRAIAGKVLALGGGEGCFREVADQILES